MGREEPTQQGNMNVTSKMVKSPSSRALVVRLNLVFFACSIVVYTALILRPSSSATCHEKGHRPHPLLSLRVPSHGKVSLGPG